MEIKILEDDKDEMKVEIGNLTVAEILRVYLNKDEGVSAAWKREHITGNIILRINAKGKTPKKALKDAIGKIDKDLEKLAEGVKRGK